jgi:uncharacterized membrane protein YqiK
MTEEETLDSLDARFGESPMRARLRALLAERDALLNLLAVIHRDGGHHATERGVLASAQAAEAEVVRLRSWADELQAGLTDANAEAVRFRGEAEDFVLHHTCGSCGAPRAQGPCTRHCDNDD